ncbi:unnamed protein product [Durusdinium trenchii]|uniref:Uncharacterized protein n=1 Tax=Durusdinium trenchii TaxID=1381693 RepID=A0ABP0P4B9_9DINO
MLILIASCLVLAWHTAFPSEVKYVDDLMLGVEDLWSEWSVEDLKMVPSLIDTVVPPKLGRALDFGQCLIQLQPVFALKMEDSQAQDFASRLCTCAVADAFSSVEVLENLKKEAKCISFHREDQDELRSCLLPICPDAIKRSSFEVST